MTTEYIDAEMLQNLKAAALAATPGPWETEKYSYQDIDGEFQEHITISSVEKDTYVATVQDFSRRDENAHYIAAANPAAILALIARVEHLEKEADWLASKIICACQIGKQCSWGMGHICKDCNENRTPIDWREAARNAIAEQEAKEARAENPGNSG